MITLELSIIFCVALTQRLVHSDDTDDIEKGHVMIADMILTPEQAQLFDDENHVRRHGLVNQDYRWPNAEVPIQFESRFDETFKKQFRNSARYISDQTCIKFLFDVNVDEHPGYVKVVKGRRSECKSQLGFLNQGKQYLAIAPRCKKGNIIHELLHTLGLMHMHQASDRDKWIKILWDNITPGYAKAYAKADKETSMFDTPYDYLSIMHYSPLGFSLDRKSPTIVSLKWEEWASTVMGQRKGLSNGDIKRINNMYNCPDTYPDDFVRRSNVTIDDEEFVVVTDYSQVLGEVFEPEEDFNV